LQDLEATFRAHCRPNLQVLMNQLTEEEGGRATWNLLAELLATIKVAVRHTCSDEPPPVTSLLQAYERRSRLIGQHRTTSGWLLQIIEPHEGAVAIKCVTDYASQRTLACTDGAIDYLKTQRLTRTLYEPVCELLHQLVEYELEISRERAVLRTISCCVGRHPGLDIPSIISVPVSETAIAMQWLPGTQLESWNTLQRPFLGEVATALAGFQQYIAANYGIVRYDTHASNVLIGEHGKIGLVDFGSTLCFSMRELTQESRPVTLTGFAPLVLSLVDDFYRSLAEAGEPSGAAPSQK
jgi:tRNA A-37 threonylcarbamoyl transferase component Bud32